MPPVYDIVTPPQYDCIDNKAVAQWLEIPSCDEKAMDLLATCARTAIDQVGTYTTKSLSPRVMSVFFDSLDGVRPIKYGPVSEEGLSMTTGGNGVVSANSTPTLDQVRGFPAPTIRGRYLNGVKLTYNAGYDVNTLPPALRTACLVCAAELYCELTGYKPSGNLTRNWRMLANPYRDFR
nr:hypothetical protein [uncultured Arsenicibacter sp.]